MIEKKPLVSICTITYKHAEFIKETIEGVLQQEVDFEVEFLIADDCSPDNTEEIVKYYQDHHPRGYWINYVKHPKNIGMIPNFSWALKECKGKYIAICEGDDYWTDVNKLQKQVNFLDSNAEYSACSHQAIVMYERDYKSSHLFRTNIKNIIELDDILNGRIFHTASLMLRAEIIKKNPIPTEVTSGDRALNFLVASYGKIFFMNEVMCVYRKNEGGVSSWVTSSMLKKDLKMIPWIYKINKKFPRYRYKSFIYKTAFTYPPKPVFWDVVVCYTLYVTYSFAFFPRNLKQVVRTTLLELPGRIRLSLNHI